eukprot:m.141937 g.141937  ORF g.141937 m.141937 type:complete len:72 (+) comp38351_c0_seq16:410-625(+)
MCMKSWKISVNALSWTLYLLGSHWDELKKFQEEFDLISLYAHVFDHVHQRGPLTQIPSLPNRTYPDKRNES